MAHLELLLALAVGVKYSTDPLSQTGGYFIGGIHLAYVTFRKGLHHHGFCGMHVITTMPK
jgi:hypothetical protein